MNKDTSKQLKELLQDWFDQTNLAGRNSFNQNDVAKLLKKELKKLGKWKDSPRGCGNSAANLSKGRVNKKELQEKVELLSKQIPKCKCGGKLIVKDNMICCDDDWCSLSDYTKKTGK